MRCSGRLIALAAVLVAAPATARAEGTRGGLLGLEIGAGAVVGDNPLTFGGGRAMVAGYRFNRWIVQARLFESYSLRSASGQLAARALLTGQTIEARYLLLGLRPSLELMAGATSAAAPVVRSGEVASQSGIGLSGGAALGYLLPHRLLAALEARSGLYLWELPGGSYLDGDCSSGDGTPTAIPLTLTLSLRLIL